jgi:hypothetical protein
VTDPTKQAQAATATAKTARETIAAHLAELKDWFHPQTLEMTAASWGKASPVGRLSASALALRALLDAPEGAAERLCEAGIEIASASDYAIGSLHDLDAKGGLGMERHRQIQRVYEALSKARGALCSALAALRASPESVGGATPSSRAAEAINTAGRIVREAEAERDNAQRTASSVSVELAVAAKERDALKADLAAARGEVERMRAEIAGDSHTCANGTVRPYPSVVCSLCVSRGITPPPATEAPISERAAKFRADLDFAEEERVRKMREDHEDRQAWLRDNAARVRQLEIDHARLVGAPTLRALAIYEGAMKLAAADPTAEDDATPTVVNDEFSEGLRVDRSDLYVSAAAKILAAAERAVKAPQAEG